jgi:hypothetical protein
VLNQTGVSFSARREVGCRAAVRQMEKLDHRMIGVGHQYTRAAQMSDALRSCNPNYHRQLAARQQ